MAKTSPKLIGGFVIGAIALVIVGVLAFGGSEFLKSKAKAVVLFEGSLSGLDVGSPVTFRGVKVGTVTGIVIKYDVEKQRLNIPVYIEWQQEKFEIVTGERQVGNLGALVQRGLRAQLELQSLVTGQVSINFDFHPEVPVRLVGSEPGITELPTAPSDIDVLKANVASVLAKINKLPLEEIGSDVVAVLKSAEQTVRTADHTLRTIEGTVKDADTQIQPLADSIKGTADQASRLLSHADADLPQIVANINQVMKTAIGALGQAEQAFRAAQIMLTPTSPLYFEVNSTLREIASAATSIRSLSDYLQRNPNSLLTGKR